MHSLPMKLLSTSTPSLLFPLLMTASLLTPLLLITGVLQFLPILLTNNLPPPNSNFPPFNSNFLPFSHSFPPPNSSNLPPPNHNFLPPNHNFLPPIPFLNQCPTRIPLLPAVIMTMDNKSTHLSLPLSPLHTIQISFSDAIMQCRDFPLFCTGKQCTM
mmetsp:Transcript_12408/g.21008  ORF Transcript_12408/g.21008 Transcript_12408/m.21008 type:complete len:158 (-) Transcript_12408:30-503(-)